MDRVGVIGGRVRAEEQGAPRHSSRRRGSGQPSKNSTGQGAKNNRRRHLAIRAEKTQLSVSTVSRALHHDPRIPEKTRKRVQQAAKELDYRPNTMMSEIASSHWQQAKVAKGSTIAFVDCNQAECGFGPTFGPAIREQALSLGYNLVIFRRRDFASSTKLQRALRNQGITDVILGPVFEESPMVELDWSKFICVQLFPSEIFPLPLHSVIKNYYNMVILAWQQAVSHGYERIGITCPF
jgi:LacI family transcriptional regulator